jgi:dynein assembly factor 1, axonemal
MALPKIACIYLRGTAFVKEFKYYRRRFIAGIPTLKFLDDKPVFEEERRLAEVNIYFK